MWQVICITFCYKILGINASRARVSSTSLSRGGVELTNMCHRRWVVVAGLLVTAAALQGCDKVADGSRAVQSVTSRTFNDTRSSWKDFLTYHPPSPDPLPQTRYCYQMQSDVVCYDSEQQQLTSKLVGFQDGETVSWVQPGGGSLGASGGAPVALRPIPKNTSPTHTTSVNDFLPFNWPSSSGTNSAAPVPTGADTINESALPPINSVATVGQPVR